MANFSIAPVKTPCYIRMSPTITRTTTSRRFFKPLSCVSVQQEEKKVESAIMCEPCDGKGWLVCDFCKGQKTNVKADNKRIYRRCPSCRAIGYVLCSKCKVFKCVTFPNYCDGEDPSF
ncbi:hypothetical protein K2173_000385 [Erythroxylum novogranatense]|uniref:Uncharacterized protein n=1 Tax=Erythroxylum novogranatense TaxID=1862640 RepID=A0AAV8SXA7_9ROSI|nr:hypothetical protein K2173_000385 [Erythroxylum novogranatense]